MYDATIKFTADSVTGIHNTRKTASDDPLAIVVWAARYGVALHYNRPQAAWKFQVTATADDVEELDIYESHAYEQGGEVKVHDTRVGIWTRL